MEPFVDSALHAEAAPRELPQCATQPRRVLPRRRLLFATLAAASLFGVAELAAAVYRVETDRGELIITSESVDVEVVVKQGGRVVRVIDTKTDKSITLRSGVYELELAGSSEGLKIDIEKATLTRGATVLAKIERLGAAVSFCAGTTRPSSGRFPRRSSPRTVSRTCHTNRRYGRWPSCRRKPGSCDGSVC